MGIQTIQIGDKSIAIPQLTTLEGYGDTLHAGDVFFFYTLSNGYKIEHGPYRFDACSASDDPWFRFTEPSGGKPLANYKGPGWSRTFRLADEETTKKVRDTLVFEGLYVRLYVRFEGPEMETLIPACWIAWVGDLQKAFREYNGPYGKLKKKNIVRWVDNCMFTEFDIKSVVPIPANFPVKIGK